MGILAQGERCVATTNRNFVDAWDMSILKFIWQVRQLQQPVPLQDTSRAHHVRKEKQHESKGQTHIYPDNVDTDVIIRLVI